MKSWFFVVLFVFFVSVFSRVVFGAVHGCDCTCVWDEFRGCVASPVINACGPCGVAVCGDDCSYSYYSEEECPDVGVGCTCESDADVYQNICVSLSCVGGGWFSSSSDYWAGDADVEARCCGDDYGEHYVVSGGNTACCDSASDCAWPNHHCQSTDSGTSVYLCVNSVWYRCDSSTNTYELVEYSTTVGDNFGACCTDERDGSFRWVYGCLCGSYRNVCEQGCDGDWMACSWPFCESGCCVGSLRYALSEHVGGAGSNDCGTLDGVYPDCITYSRGQFI